MTPSREPPGSAPDAHPTASPWPRRRRVLLGLAVGALGCALVGWYVVVPNPTSLDNRNPERTALMKQRMSEASHEGSTYEISQQWVPLEEISPVLVRAVIVAEDYRFRQHQGVDWVSVAEEVQWAGDDDFSWLSAADLAALRAALEYTWTHREEVRGRSTITQQLAKNLYWGTERTFLRKGLELVVAGRLEKRLDKDRILEIYLNVAEWGPGIFGVEAAAQAYFGRPASALTLDQSAALAATLPHPLTSNPTTSPRRMLWRKELLLERLDPKHLEPPPPLPRPVPNIELEFDVSDGLSLPV
jgi:monofunctional biosynthetic peptidoglycan transglycosylase